MGAVSPISFSTIDIDFELRDAEQLRDWLIQVAGNEHGFIGRLHYHFCSDEHLLAMNLKHLDHDYYTDVITFDQSRLPLVNGDVFISVDRVRENAAENEADELLELYRVMAHGLLHLLGYADKSDEEVAIMRDKERHALELIH
jgi:rRNA maturation RNase YbeY